MALGSDKGRGARTAFVAAALALALTQLLAVAHAEDDHDEHASDAHCALCTLAVADDDIDAPPRKDFRSPVPAMESGKPSPASLNLEAAFASPSEARGPPHN